MSEPERIFHVQPGYDCIGVQPCVHGSERCKPGTGGSHGRHNAEMHLIVRGADAEITLVVSTGWDLPTVPAYHRLTTTQDYPRGAFVDLHTARPRYDGQDGGEARPDGSCKDWAGCYADRGYSMADEPTRLLVEKGSEAAWEWLEALYSETQAEMAAANALATADRARAMSADEELRDQAKSHIESLLSEVYLPEGVQIWMTSPHHWLGGRCAVDLIAEGRAAEVLAAAERLVGGAW